MSEDQGEEEKHQSGEKEKPKWGNLKKIILGVAGAVIAWNSLYVVDQTQHAVITQLGKPVAVVYNPIEKDEAKTKELKEKYAKEHVRLSSGAGLKAKIPFIEHVNYLDRRWIPWDGFPEQIPTKDKKFIWVDTIARWSIENPLLFLQTLRTVDNAQGRMDDILDAQVRNVVSNHNLVEAVRNSNRNMLISEDIASESESTQIENIDKGRYALTREILNASIPMGQQYGIQINDTRIKAIDYVEEVKTSIYGRMSAERMRIANKYRSEGRGEAEKIMGKKEKDLKQIVSDAYRKSQEIEGNGDAKATAIYASAYGRGPEFYAYTKSLEILRDTMDTRTNIVVGTDSKLFKRFSEK